MRIHGDAFAPRLDGLPSYALFQGPARLQSDGHNVALTDPAREPLETSRRLAAAKSRWLGVFAMPSDRQSTAPTSRLFSALCAEERLGCR